MTATRLVAGCMTGTSLDGLDSALVRITGSGPRMQVEFVSATSIDLGQLGARMRAVAEQKPHTAAAIAELARDFAALHVTALDALPKPRLIAIHGQTVYHRPPLSWQLFNAAPVAHAFGVPVVFDLRAMDLAAGGQGAPITPIADWVVFRSATEHRAIVNLGGFCNVTILKAGADVDAVSGADVCACNQLLDAIARRRMHAAFDEDGRCAAGGKVVDSLQRELSSLMTGQGRSLGTGDELSAWVDAKSSLPAEDLARTACAAIAACIAGATRGSEHLIVAGGGSRHRTLLQEIEARTRARVSVSDALGLPAQYREAAHMAILGALCQDRVPITLPSITGVAKAPISGTWILP